MFIDNRSLSVSLGKRIFKKNFLTLYLACLFSAEDIEKR